MLGDDDEEGEEEEEDDDDDDDDDWLEDDEVNVGRRIMSTVPKLDDAFITTHSCTHTHPHRWKPAPSR